MKWLMSIIATLLLCGSLHAQTGPAAVFDVRKFGAIPDDATDDTTAFQDAFDAAAAAAPAKIIIPRGNWTMTDSVTVEDASDITIKAEDASIQATVRICPAWFVFDECTNIQWDGGKFVGVSTFTDVYDRFISTEDIDRPVTSITTGEVITTSFDHGLRVGDSVSFHATDSTPALSGTYTVSALDTTNPLRKFTITGVDVTIAGTTGYVRGVAPRILAVGTNEVVTCSSTSGLVNGGSYKIIGTTCDPAIDGTRVVTVLSGTTFSITGVDVTTAQNTPAGFCWPTITSISTGEVVTVPSTANLTDGGTYYISGSTCTPSIDGLRAIDVLSSTTFTLLDTAECDTVDVTVAQSSSGGVIRSGVDDKPTVNGTTYRLSDDESCRVFQFIRGRESGIRHIKAMACEALLHADRCNDWIVQDVHFDGPFTLGWAQGLRPNYDNDHKQVDLPCYMISCEGGWGWTVRDTYCRYAAGSVVNGSGNPVITTEQDRIAAFSHCLNVNTDTFMDNGIYISSGRFCEVIGGTTRNGIGSGTGVKFRGYGHQVSYHVAENLASGYGIEGTLQRSTIDDPWGFGAAQCSYFRCVARNCSDAGFWTDDNNGMWPHNVSIKECDISNCGMQAQTLATDNLPAVNKYGDYTGVLSAVNKAPVQLINVDSLDFIGNRIDSSEGGQIMTSSTSSDGFVVFEVPEQLTITRRIGLRTYITVAGHSVSGYNGVHHITDITGTTTGTGRYLKTDTTYTSAGTGGTWDVSKNDYQVYVGLSGTASNNSKAAASLNIKDNTLVGGKNGFYLTDVTDAEITGNRGVQIDGGNPSALFKVGNLRRSRVEYNRVSPLGSRVLSVDSLGIYSGNTVQNNEGAIYTALAATTVAFDGGGAPTTSAPWHLPQSGMVLHLESDLIVDASNATRGDETVMYADQNIGADANKDHRYGDARILVEDAGTDYKTVATWLDRLTHARFYNDTHANRPTLEMGATYSGGSDADLLNGHNVVRFDGSNDLLKVPTEVSLSSTGTIYVVAKRRTDSPTTQALLASCDEGSQNTYFRLEENTSAGELRLRIRNGGSDTETLARATTTAIAVNTWKIVRVSSNGTNISMAISNGSGTMTSQSVTVTGTDGRWFDDVGTGSAGLPRDGFYIGGERRTTATDPEDLTWGAYDIAAVLVYDGDVSANFTAIEAYLRAQYGAL